MTTNRLLQHDAVSRRPNFTMPRGATADREYATPRFATYLPVGIVLLVCTLAIPAQAGDTLPVALRWCVVGNDVNGNKHWDPGEQGTPAFTNPGGVLNGQGMPEPDTDNVLWRRHERASDNTWIP